MKFLNRIFSLSLPRYIPMILDFGFVLLLFEIYSIVLKEEIFFFDTEIVFLVASVMVLVGRFIGIYDSLNRFFNIAEFSRFIVYLFIISFCFIVLLNDYRWERYFIIFFSLALSTLPYRFVIKFLFSVQNNSEKKIALLFGAGNGGLLVKRSFENSSYFKIIGFIDEDSKIIGRRLDGLYVRGFDDKLELFLKKKNIRHVIFTTDKIDRERKQHFLEFFKKLSISTYDLPPSAFWEKKKPSVASLRKIRVEDLLSRSEIVIDENSNNSFYSGKVILITGAAGSIGSELVRQLINYLPQKIVVVDINETALFNLKEELSGIEIVSFVLMNALDEYRLNKLFEDNNFHCVIHAAAYKHVSVVEENPIEGIRNNVLSTYFLSKNALKHKVSKFILVSTDKAVNPTNVMGASKRICELLIASFRNITSSTDFVTTRFGNVLGSNGSVIPIFRKQIESGGPVTLTDPEMTRYFMTIPEASKLVLEAGRLGKDNQIFIFDMGDPVLIKDLAYNMISLSGFKPNEDIEIKITGLRPGEKLYEELLLNTETMIPSKNPHIYIAEKEMLSDVKLDLLNRILSQLSKSDYIDELELVRLVKMLVPEFISNNSKFEELD